MVEVYRECVLNEEENCRSPECVCNGLRGEECIGMEYLCVSGR